MFINRMAQNTFFDYLRIILFFTGLDHHGAQAGPVFCPYVLKMDKQPSGFKEAEPHADILREFPVDRDSNTAPS